MISKVAKVQALREAFPTQLGAMYTQEEHSVEDVTYEDVSKKVESEKSEKANKTTITLEANQEQVQSEAQVTDKSAENAGLFGSNGGKKSEPSF